MSQKTSAFMSRVEFSRAVGVDPDTVSRWIDQGELAATRIGGRVLVPRSELERLMDEALRRRDSAAPLNMAMGGRSR